MYYISIRGELDLLYVEILGCMCYDMIGMKGPWRIICNGTNLLGNSCYSQWISCVPCVDDKVEH